MLGFAAFFSFLWVLCLLVQFLKQVVSNEGEFYKEKPFSDFLNTSLGVMTLWTKPKSAKPTFFAVFFGINCLITHAIFHEGEAKR